MGVYEQGEERWTDEGADRTAGIGRGSGADDPTAVPDVEGDEDTAELVAQIRALAAHDPMGVQQVVNEVLAALDRATHGAFRDQLSAGTPLSGGFGEPSVRVTETAAAEQRTDP